MNDNEIGDRSEGGATIGVRWPELIVAVILQALAVLVIVDSLRVGIGWASDGPRAGYFPFYIGLFLLGASTTIVVKTLLKWREAKQVFAAHSQLKDVLAVLAPMIVYVLLVKFLGIYLPSMLLIGWFMQRHGKFSWLKTVAISVSAPIVFFLVFERWFLVPLPKGPIEHLLGF